MRILTFGTFDHFHPGHLSYLSQAQQKGDLYVIVARDSNVQKIKGHTPQQDENVRRQKVQEAFPTATVMLGDPEDFLKPVHEITPDVIVLGYDQHLPPHVSQSDLPCPIARAESFEPHIHKSSLRRKT